MGKTWGILLATMAHCCLMLNLLSPAPPGPFLLRFSSYSSPPGCAYVCIMPSQLYHLAFSFAGFQAVADCPVLQSVYPDPSAGTERNLQLSLAPSVNVLRMHSVLQPDH